VCYFEREDGWTKWRLADHQGRLVGRAGFGGTNSSRELSYTIRRELWGRGLATEIARALAKWHSESAPGIPLRAFVEVGNDASVKVLENAGFIETGTEARDGAVCRLFSY
jgi:RimJ/RimL family protein N-acetyltransferase